MKDNVKRLLAFVLAAVMLVSLCPTLGVSAATAEPGIPADRYKENLCPHPTAPHLLI